ncbi:hypothetical protein ACHAW6_009512 [Cyclotella cf. meneghiniana]
MTDMADTAAGNAADRNRQDKPNLTDDIRVPTSSNLAIVTPPASRRNDNKPQRPSLLRRQSSLLLTHIQSSLPATPTTWALLSLAVSSALLQHELRLQRSLSAPPDVFCNLLHNERMSRLYDKLSREGGIFSRSVVPSLFVGTRGVVSSIAAYALKPGGTRNQNKIKVNRAREVMTMGADGAKILLDWEIPNTTSDGFQSSHCGEIGKMNSISRPVVLLVHGMNNDSSFGYIRSMMKTATSRGWVAVCMNLRGQDGMGKLKNSTPRGYNAGYTGDLRGVILQLEKRLLKRSRQSGENKAGTDEYIGGPIYLIGYSLGANIVTKYLGEESLHGTLPSCIGGGAALGNPLHIASNSIPFPWNMILAMGVKRSILQNFPVYSQHRERGFQNAMKKAMLSRTIGQLDDACAPYILRNEPYPPYAPRVGYRNGKEYWHDSSSHRYVGHVSVPLLKIAAKDDFLLNHCLENPNVVVVKTRCGGHLGWQESPPLSRDADGNELPSTWFGGGIGSWSDVAVADFIEALLEARNEDHSIEEKEGKNGRNAGVLPKLVSKL